MKRATLTSTPFSTLDLVLDMNTTLQLFQHEEKVGNLALLLKRQGLEKKISPLFLVLFGGEKSSKSSNGFCKRGFQTVFFKKFSSSSSK